MSDEIRRILDAANQAPSGENCQPWRFVVSGLSIEVHVRPERDQSHYSWGQRASYLACGAALENLVIAASAEGYAAAVAYAPHSSDPWHVATVTLHKDPQQVKDPLADYVYARVSNRKSYASTPLSAPEKAALKEAAERAGSGTFSLTEDRAEVRTLGRVGSTNEEVMLANRSLHDFFFSHVSWTKEEDEKNKMGFYIKTLELPPPAEKMFKVFSNWSLMRVLAPLGFSRIVAKQNAAVNATAAAIGAFMISGTEPLDFVRVGRSIERVWLTATSLGLAFQPLAGIPFFKLKIAAGEHEIFTPSEQKLILAAHQRAAQIFKAGDAHLAFMCRIGRAEPPSAHAIRFPLEDAVQVNHFSYK